LPAHSTSHLQNTSSRFSWCDPVNHPKRSNPNQTFTPHYHPEAIAINNLQIDYERKDTRQNLVAIWIWTSEFELANSPFVNFDKLAV
jgi:hypothetical protein